MATITTRVVKNEQITRGPKPLGHVTTKDVEVKYIDKEPPFEAPKNEPVTTHDFEDIAEKNKRAQVAAEIEALKWPEDILIGTFGDGDEVGLYDPNWKKEPVRSTKKEK